MDNHKSLFLKLSRHFPSFLSLECCQSRVVTNVAHNSVVITKSKKNPKPENTYSDSLNPNPKKKERVRNQSSSSNNGQLFTSSDERTFAAADGFEIDTFYSLSLSSGDSSRPKTTGKTRSREEMEMIDETGCDQASARTYYDSGRRSGRKSGGVIEEGLAVERRSTDPYGDFMASMVEMIIQKQMFGAEDLDRLLYRFLALNEAEYHGIIFRVYSEICHILFGD